MPIHLRPLALNLQPIPTISSASSRLTHQHGTAIHPQPRSIHLHPRSFRSHHHPRPNNHHRLLNYFSHLGSTLTSNEPSGRSAPAPILPYRSNHTAACAAQREFTYYYGEDVNNLAAWQALLSTCAFEVIP